MAATASALNLGTIKHLFAGAWKEWNQDNAPRLGASLAYYTMLSLAPLLVVIIGVAGLVFGKDAAQGQIFYQVRGMVGDQGAAAIQTMIQGAAKMGQGIFATILGFAALLFGATSVVAELRSALNAVWNVPQDPNAGVKDVLKQRSYALAVVLGCGFLLLVSLVVSAGLAAAGKFMGGLLPIPEAVMQVINMIISLVVITGVFALIFKFLPDVQIDWQDVFLGAALTALLFTIGKFALGMYLGKAGFGSTYGAAGSLVIVLVWVYYSAQIMFFGAEFTQVYAREHGSHRAGARNRQPIDDKVASPAVGTYASSAASGNTMMRPHEGVANRSRGFLVGTAMITAVFAAAANEVRGAFGRRAKS
jgi:membrane protein